VNSSTPPLNTIAETNGGHRQEKAETVWPCVDFFQPIAAEVRLLTWAGILIALTGHYPCTNQPASYYCSAFQHDGPQRITGHSIHPAWGCWILQAPGGKGIRLIGMQCPAGLECSSVSGEGVPMDVFFTSSGLVALITLTFLEIVLGVENVIFISILSSSLPASQQATARRIGLLAAMRGRILLLLLTVWIIRLTAPLSSGWIIGSLNADCVK